MPAASQHLRSLESRGLLQVSRSGRHVHYRPVTAAAPPSLTHLLTSLRRQLRHESEGIEEVFKLATAFTHPRRIQVIRMIAARPSSLLLISASLRIPFASLSRHITKLASRGFIEEHEGHWRIASPLDGLRRHLLDLALADEEKT